MTFASISRRELLGGVFAWSSATLLWPRNLLALPRPVNFVALPDLRERGETDDVAALRRALTTGRPVYMPAGRGSAADGAYLIGSDGTSSNLVSGARIFGDGMRRTIVRKAAANSAYIVYVDSGSPDPARNVSGIALSDLTLEDDVARLGFSEHAHLMHVNGVTGLTVERVEFKGFRGDALYLGSSRQVDGERHNRRVTVIACRFDGINSNNRNGISIIDGDGITIRNCQFLNITRRGDGTTRYPRTRAQVMDPNFGLAMPAAIDCEPDANRFAIVRNISIDGCRFSGGGGAAVGLLLRPNHLLRTPLSGFSITNCFVERQRIGFIFFGFSGRDAVLRNLPYNVLYRGNEIRECDSPFIINGARGLRMETNLFTDCAKAAELGYTDYNHDCNLVGNRFVRVGYSRNGVNGLLIRYADGVTLESNSFIDCGQADGSGGRAINFAAGEIMNFQLIGNRFESPTGRTTYAIGVTGATVDRRSSVGRGNVFTFRTNRDFE